MQEMAQAMGKQAEAIAALHKACRKYDLPFVVSEGVGKAPPPSQCLLSVFGDRV